MIQSCDGCSGGHGASAEYGEEEAKAGHDTFAQGVVNGAVVVTDLADLSQFEQSVANNQLIAWNHTCEVYSLDDEVFAEGAGEKRGQTFTGFVDIFLTEDADLPVARPGMGVTFEAPLFF